MIDAVTPNARIHAGIHLRAHADTIFGYEMEYDKYDKLIDQYYMKQNRNRTTGAGYPATQLANHCCTLTDQTERYSWHHFKPCHNIFLAIRIQIFDRNFPWRCHVALLERILPAGAVDVHILAVADIFAGRACGHRQTLAIGQYDSSAGRTFRSKWCFNAGCRYHMIDSIVASQIDTVQSYV